MVYSDKLHEYSDVLAKFQNKSVIDLEERISIKSDYQLFDLHEAGPLLNYSVPPVKDDRYHIFLLKKGSGKMTIGVHKFDLKDNLLAVVPRKIIYSLSYGPDAQGYSLFFSEDFFVKNAFPPKHLAERCILRSTFCPYITLSDVQCANIAAILDAIRMEINTASRSKREMIGLKILELLITCDRYYIEADNVNDVARASDMYERLRLFIDRHFDKSRKVNFYAKLLGIHPNHLNFVIKRDHGVSVKQLIDNRIIAESKYLLVHTDYTIKEVAYKLGFEDQNYFSFFFKKHTGVPAQQYRENIGLSNNDL